MAKIVDISSDIFKFELDEPTDLSIASISMWLRTNIGQLNNLLNNNFTINSSYDIIDENGNDINESQVSILKKLFEIYYYKKQSKTFLGAAGVDSVSQISQDGIVTRFVDRNGISKSYLEMYKDAKEELKQLLNHYKIKNYNPTQVSGDDTIPKISNILNCNSNSFINK